MKNWLFVIFLVALVATISCRFGLPIASPTPDISAIVSATLTAVGASAPAPVAATALPISSEPGSIIGSLNYPSSRIPPLFVVAIDTNNPSSYYFVNTVLDQSTFQLNNVPAGTYHVIAYALGGEGSSIGGGYTPAVACGLSVDCTDHTLLDVVVVAGQVTAGIDLKDWYAGAGVFPTPPPMPNP